MVTYNGLKIADCGFFINLKKDTDRLTHILNTLKENAIEGVERFDALTSKNGNTSRNGSFLSHLNLIKKFGETGLESCLIIEDDIEFTEYLTLENILLINEKLKDDTVDAIWLGGCPKTVFKESDNFSYVFSKSCAFGVIIKKSFYDKLIPFIEKNKRIGSADSFYNRMIYGDIETTNTISEIINNKDIPNIKAYDLIYSKQLIFNYPILLESEMLYSNNTSVRILNGDRKKTKDYKKGYLSRMSLVKDIDDIDEIKITDIVQCL
jgi:GR25 family glycosyltransferase involved in LPS biosynthesis